MESQLSKNIAHQIRGTRDGLGWSQERLAEESQMNQNAISRLESVDYGKPTLTTLKRLAEAMDVGLIVRFVPFSEMADWVSGTLRLDTGLSSKSLRVPSFQNEESRGVFDQENSLGLLTFNHLLTERSVISSFAWPKRILPSVFGSPAIPLPSKLGHLDLFGGCGVSVSSDSSLLSQPAYKDVASWSPNYGWKTQPLEYTPSYLQVNALTESIE